MLSIMDEVGSAIREKFFWVPKEKTIFLFMDNAGGHGTDDAVRKYTNDLMEK
jgi:hypothetical protein